MSALRQTRSLVHRLALLALVVAFALGAALPAGVMPVRSDAGVLTVVLCTPDGPQDMQIDLGPVKQKRDPSPCPFAVLHLAGLAQAAAPVPGAPLRLARAKAPPVPLSLVPASFPRSTLARAPPVPA